MKSQILCPSCGSDEIKLRIEGDYQCLYCGNRFLDKDGETLLIELRRQTALLRKITTRLDQLKGENHD